MWARIGAIAGLTALSAGIGVAIYAGWVITAPASAVSTPSASPATTKGG